MSKASIGMVSLLFFFAACGGGGSSSSTDSGGSGGGGGTASVKSLSSVPSADISNIDYGTSSSSLSLPEKSLDAVDTAENTAPAVKGLGGNMDAVGGASRAGCETNAHWNEGVRLSQEIQLDRCYAQTAEKLKIVTIGSEDYTYYSLVPDETDIPEQGRAGEEDLKKACDDMRDPDAKAECEKHAKEGGHHGGSMLVRMGVFGSELRIDSCDGAKGKEVLVSEATYSSDGTTYTGSAIRKGNWNGGEEGMSFNYTIKASKVTDGIVTLSSGDSATATGKMKGNFGSGTATYEADGTTQANTITAGFKGEFKDPNNTAQTQKTSFTGKVYAKWGGTAATKTGSAKFSFSGTMPCMKASNLIPPDVSASDQSAVYSTLGSELGTQISATDCLCPNPDFDPKSPDTAIAPMIKDVNSDGLCSQTFTDTESFKIATITDKGDKYTKKSKVFTIIADSAAEFYTVVNAYKLDTVSADAGTISFARSWNCTAPSGFSKPDFKAAFQSGTLTSDPFADCQALEEKINDNRGMGDWNCAEAQHKGDVDKLVQEGPPDFGTWGGELARQSETCATDPPQRLFFESRGNNKYCFPTHKGCSEFTIASGGGVVTINVEIEEPPGSGNKLNITTLDAQAGANKQITFTITQGNGTCQGVYTLSQPNFSKPKDFDPNAQQGQQGAFPAACNTAGAVTEESCKALCSRADHPCAS